jgi:hypothetical protein
MGILKLPSVLPVQLCLPKEREGRSLWESRDQKTGNIFDSKELKQLFECGKRTCHRPLASSSDRRQRSSFEWPPALLPFRFVLHRWKAATKKEKLNQIFDEGASTRGGGIDDGVDRESTSMPLRRHVSNNTRCISKTQQPVPFALLNLSPTKSLHQT